MHRLNPLKSLIISQKSATILLDLIWLENALPKLISKIQQDTSIIVSTQKGLIKLYFLSFLITMATALFIFSFHA